MRYPGNISIMIALPAEIAEAVEWWAVKQPLCPSTPEAIVQILAEWRDARDVPLAVA